jgi:hypothetical protein
MLCGERLDEQDAAGLEPVASALYQRARVEVEQGNQVECAIGLPLGFFEVGADPLDGRAIGSVASLQVAPAL